MSGDGISKTSQTYLLTAEVKMEKEQMASTLWRWCQPGVSELPSRHPRPSNPVESVSCGNAHCPSRRSDPQFGGAFVTALPRHEGGTRASSFLPSLHRHRPTHNTLFLGLLSGSSQRGQCWWMQWCGIFQKNVRISWNICWTVYNWSQN